MTNKKTLQTVSTIGNVLGLAVSVVPFFGGYTLPFPLIETIRNALVISQSAINLSVGILKKNKPLIIENSLVLGLSVPMGMLGMRRFIQRQQALSKSLHAFTLEEKAVQRELSSSFDENEESVLSKSGSQTLFKKQTTGGEEESLSPLHKESPIDESETLRKKGSGARVPLQKSGHEVEHQQPSLETFSPERQQVQEEEEPFLPRHVNQPTQDLRKKMTSVLGRFALAEDDVTQATNFLSKGYSLNKSLNSMGALPDMAKNITMFDRSDLSLYRDEINTLLKENIFFQNDNERQSYLYWYMRQVNRLVSPLHSAINLALTK